MKEKKLFILIKSIVTLDVWNEITRFAMKLAFAQMQKICLLVKIYRRASSHGPCKISILCLLSVISWKEQLEKIQVLDDL